MSLLNALEINLSQLSHIILQIRLKGQAADQGFIVTKGQGWDLTSDLIQGRNTAELMIVGVITNR